MSAPVLTYHPNYREPPCVALGEVVVCTFPVYASDDPDLPDQKRHALGRMFAASPKMLAALEAVERFYETDHPGMTYLQAFKELRAQVRAAITEAKGDGT